MPPSIFLFLIVTAVLFTVGRASIMPNPIGVTIPSGDIFVESNESLELFCVIHNSNAAFEDLRFIADGNNVTSDVTKINATTIRLYVKNPEPQIRLYQCLMDNQIVDQNFIFVTVKPSEMKCISYDYDKLNCSFKSSGLPSNTKYEARLSITGKRYNNREWTTIDNVITLNNEEYYFVLDESTKLQYRTGHGRFEVFLKITITFPKFNRIKEYNLNAMFDESKHVIPGAATKLQVIATTAKHVELTYHLSHRMNYISYSIEHLIIWSCKCGQKKWNGKDSFNATAKRINYNMTDLPYAHAFCNVSVYLKVSQAAYDKMWSNNATIANIRTGSTVPEKVPEVLPGAFQIGKTFNETYAVIYWRDIPEELQNGPNFTYHVEIKGLSSEQIQVMNSFAVIRHFDDSVDTRIEIQSKNIVGVSAKKTTVVIPKTNNTITRNLESFTQWISSGITYLSWEFGKHHNNTNGFSVFSCDDWNEKTQLCSTQVETVNVVKSKQDNYYEIHQNSSANKKYGISFKNLRNWSGLFWSMCTINGKDSPEIHLSIIDVAISKIGLKWTLPCKDMVVPISGYVVSYCKSSEQLQECDGEINNITITGDRTTGHCEIENMDVETRYLIWVSTVTVFGKLQKSKILPYFNECMPDSSLFYWSIPIGIIFLILAAVSSKMLYRKSKNCWNVDVAMPPGLQVGPFDRSINEKQIRWLDWPLNAKMHKIIQRSNKEKLQPTLATKPSEVSLQLSMNVQQEQKEIVKQYQELNLPKEAEEKSKPYVQVGFKNYEEDNSDEESPSLSDEISCHYVRNTTIPDLLHLPQEEHSLQQDKRNPYVLLKDIDKLSNEDNVPIGSPYVVAGKCATETFTSIDDLHKSVMEENSPYIAEIPVRSETALCKPYVPLGSLGYNSEKDVFINEYTALKPQKNQYVPFDELHNTITEKAPLLQLPQCSHVVKDSRTEIPRPYVTVGDLVRDTPA